MVEDDQIAADKIHGIRLQRNLTSLENRCGLEIACHILEGGGTGVIKKKLCSHLYESPLNYGREMKQCMKGTDATPNILNKLKRRKSLKKILI